MSKVDARFDGGFLFAHGGTYYIYKHTIEIVLHIHMKNIADGHGENKRERERETLLLRSRPPKDFVLDFRRGAALNVLRQHLRLSAWAAERQRRRTVGRVEGQNAGLM